MSFLLWKTSGMILLSVTSFRHSLNLNCKSRIWSDFTLTSMNRNSDFATSKNFSNQFHNITEESIQSVNLWIFSKLMFNNEKNRTLNLKTARSQSLSLSQILTNTTTISKVYTRKAKSVAQSNFLLDLKFWLKSNWTKIMGIILSWKFNNLIIPLKLWYQCAIFRYWHLSHHSPVITGRSQTQTKSDQNCSSISELNNFCVWFT